MSGFIRALAPQEVEARLHQAVGNVQAVGMIQAAWRQTLVATGAGIDAAMAELLTLPAIDILKQNQPLAEAEAALLRHFRLAEVNGVSLLPVFQEAYTQQRGAEIWGVIKGRIPQNARILDYISGNSPIKTYLSELKSAEIDAADEMEPETAEALELKIPNTTQPLSRASDKRDYDIILSLNSLHHSYDVEQALQVISWHAANGASWICVETVPTSRQSQEAEQHYMLATDWMLNCLLHPAQKLPLPDRYPTLQDWIDFLPSGGWDIQQSIAPSKSLIGVSPAPQAVLVLERWQRSAR